MLLLFGAVLAAQLPAVQTYLAHKAIKVLDDKIDGELVIGRIHASPFDGVIINDIAIIDEHPFESPTLPREDTLFRAKSIVVTFSPKGLLSKECVKLSYAKVQDALFVLTSEPVEDPNLRGTSNIKRIFRLKPRDTVKEKKNKEIFRIDDVEVDGMEYRMKNFKTPRKPRTPSPDVINWRDLDVRDIHLKGRRLSMKAGVISGIADRLTFNEKSGFAPSLISGDVSVGNGHTEIKGLRIVDVDSDIHMSEFHMRYANTKSFSHFLQDVKIDADILPSKVSPKTISYFAKGMKKMDFDITAEGSYHGPVADFRLDDLSFRNNNDNMYGTVDGRLSGLPSMSDLRIDAVLSDVNFNLEELERFIKGIVPSLGIDLGKFAKGQRFDFDGSAKGTLNKLAVQGQGISNIGDFRTDLDIRNAISKRSPMQIVGNLNTSSLDLGKLAGTEKVGPCTMFARVGATLAKGNPQVVVDTLIIGKIRALDYTYSDLSGKGKYSSDGFEGTLSSGDPNLAMNVEISRSKPTEEMDGGYQVAMDVERADMAALNLYKHGTAIVSFNTEAFVNEHFQSGKNGEIQVNDIMIQDMNGIHKIGNMLIAGTMDTGQNDISMNSSVIDGQYSGTGTPADFAKDLKNLVLCKEMPALFGQADGDWTGNSYDVDLSIHDSQDLLSFLVPGLYVADNTDACIRITEEGFLKGEVHSGRLAFKDKYLKSVEIDLDNSDGALNAQIASDELSISPILTKDNRIMAFASKNTLGIGLTYDNQTELANRGEFFMTCDIDRCASDSLDLHGVILQSNVYINSQGWTISPAKIDVENGHIKIDGFRLDNDNQSLSIDGGYSKEYKDSLNLRLNQFNIAALNPFLGNKFGLGGYATGTAVLGSPKTDGINLQANIRIDNAMISDRSAGTMVLSSRWNEAAQGFDLNVRNTDHGTVPLSASALIVPLSKTLDGNVSLEGFNLGFAEPMLKSVFSELGGKLSGTINISGPLSKMDIESNGLKIDDGLMRVDFTNVEYKVAGPIHLDNEGAWFDNDDISDRYGERGKVNGGIGWNHFKDMKFNTRISFSDMEVLNLREDAGQAFYGNVFGTGNVRITGPMNALLLDINASTCKEGSFHIPMSGASSASNSDLLTFKEPEVEYIIDPYEVMMGRYGQQAGKVKNDMGVLLKLNVDQGTQALVEIDKTSGNVLSGRGTGNLEIEVRPSRDVFNLNGNYDLVSGNYHLDVLGIAKKDFAIQEGSTVRFTGDIMDSDLDINAIYRTKASIGTLIADTTSTARRTVECGISISDKIRNPQIGFSINVPDIDPSTQAMVENALNTEDKVQKQFISLLISSSFLPDEQSGIVNNTNMLNTTVTEIMAGQLNNILQKLDIPIDLGLDFQQGSNGRSIYDVAISTELFNNKVLVNGTIGNRQYSSAGTSNDEVVGDLDIEIKLDRTGALRLNLFSHSADQYTSYLDDSQRNGAGFTYQREFNSLKEYFRDLFRSKEDRKAAETARQQAEMNTERTVLIIEE